MKRQRRTDGIDPVLRGRARRRALQAIYAWQVAGGDAKQVIAQFAHEQAREIADLEYFEDLVRGTIGRVAVAMERELHVARERPAGF